MEEQTLSGGTDILSPAEEVERSITHEAEAHHMQAVYPLHHSTQRLSPVWTDPLAQHRFLKLHLSNWKLSTANKWVLHTLTQGYALQFCQQPPRFSGVLKTTAGNPAEKQKLCSEISLLLEKHAMVEVEPV